VAVTVEGGGCGLCGDQIRGAPHPS
jgi:hypothetical protein